jgi:magnesium-transporting ATPase (P-type)
MSVGPDGWATSGTNTAADKGLAENVREHLYNFGNDALRTLALAHSLIEPSVYLAWNERFAKAALSLEDREDKLRDLADEIETNLTLLGASAIEDRLQDGVPETICALGAVRMICRAGRTVLAVV